MRLIALIILSVMLTSCGQTGGLYMPDDANHKKTQS